jgi:hypothetical protein
MTSIIHEGSGLIARAGFYCNESGCKLERDSINALNLISRDCNKIKKNEMK